MTLVCSSSAIREMFELASFRSFTTAVPVALSLSFWTSSGKAPRATSNSPTTRIKRSNLFCSIRMVEGAAEGAAGLLAGTWTTSGDDTGTWLARLWVTDFRERHELREKHCLASSALRLLNSRASSHRGIQDSELLRQWIFEFRALLVLGGRRQSLETTQIGFKDGAGGLAVVFHALRNSPRSSRRTATSC